MTASPTQERLYTELQQALAPRIELERELGAGGMGTVYLGRDPALKRMVVVKVMLPELANDPGARARFAREAESAAAVSHPNVVSVFQVGELPGSGTAYFVMQYVDGLTLAEAFPPGQVVPESRARRVIGEVASALAAAHARGLIHRDIKPSNIMLERGSGRAVVLDFGISAALGQRARAQAQKLTAQGTSIGTPEYMSPEQAAADDITDRSDVYSLGVVGFELLTGRLPFVDTTPMALAAAHIKDPPPPVRSVRPDVDPQLSELVDRCLIKQPEARPAADDVARALLMSAAAPIEWPPPSLERLRGRGRQLLQMLSGIALLAALLLTSMGYGMIHPSAAWYRRSFGSLTPDVAEVAVSEIGTLPYILASVLSLAAAALLIASFYGGVRLSGLLRWARRGGYPWRVLFDVMMDAGPDTAHLLNGTGPYGLASAEERERLLRRRRWSAILSMVAISLCVPGAIAIAGGWLPEPADPAILLPFDQLLLLAAAPMIAWLLSRAILVPEMRLRRRGERSSLPALRRPPIRPELVSAWLASARYATPPNAGRLATLLRAQAPLVAALAIGAALLMPAVLASFAGLIGGWVLGQTSGRSDAIGLLRQARSDSEQRRWPRFDSLVAIAGRLPSTGAAGVAAADTLMLLAIREQPGSPLWSGSDEARALVRERYPAVPRARTDTTTWRALPGRIPEERRRTLVADTSSPRLHLWRLLAGADSLAPLWMIRPGFSDWSGGEGTMMDDRTREYYHATLYDLVQRNSSAAMLALERGDHAAAVRHARENIAAASRLGGLPLLGPDRLFEQALVSLREVARVTGDSVTGAQARALADLKPRRTGFWFARETLMADPLSPPGLAIVADTSARAVLRWSLIAGVSSGVCINTREVISGASHARHATLDRIAAATRDLPRTDEWVNVQRRRLERFSALGFLGRLRACFQWESF